MDDRPLRIGVDARPLATPWNGIGTYLRGVFEQLQTIEGHQWFLYSDRSVDLPKTDNAVTLRHGNLSGSLVSTAYAQWQFPRWANQDQCDLFWSPRHQLPLGLSPKMATVLSIHDLVFRTHPQTMRATGRLLEKTLTPPSMRRATRLLMSSESVRQELGHYYPKLQAKSHTVLLSSSIAEHLDATEQLQDESRTDDLCSKLPAQPYFVFSGSLEPRKNVDRLLTAFQQLSQDANFAHHLVIVSGGGWHNTKTMQTIDKLHNRVHLLQNLSEADKAKVFQAADFVALPSLHEGFGIPIAEGIKLGKPILTSRTASMPEVAGEAGEYVDPLSVSSIADGIFRLSNDVVHRAALADVACSMAHSYSWHDCAQQTMQIFKAAANRLG